MTRSTAQASSSRASSFTVALASACIAALASACSPAQPANAPSAGSCSTSAECLKDPGSFKEVVEACVQTAGEGARAVCECTTKQLVAMNLPMPNGEMSASDTAKLQARAKEVCSPAGTFTEQCMASGPELGKAYCECGSQVFDSMGLAKKDSLSESESKAFSSAVANKCAEKIPEPGLKATFTKGCASEVKSLPNPEVVCGCVYGKLRGKYKYKKASFMDQSNPPKEADVAAATTSCMSEK